MSDQDHFKGIGADIFDSLIDVLDAERAKVAKLEADKAKLRAALVAAKGMCEGKPHPEMVEAPCTICRLILVLDDVLAEVGP